MRKEEEFAPPTESRVPIQQSIDELNLPKDDEVTQSSPTIQHSCLIGNVVNKIIGFFNQLTAVSATSASL